MGWVRRCQAAGCGVLVAPSPSRKRARHGCPAPPLLNPVFCLSVIINTSNKQPRKKPEARGWNTSLGWKLGCPHCPLRGSYWGSWVLTVTLGLLSTKKGNLGPVCFGRYTGNFRDGGMVHKLCGRHPLHCQHQDRLKCVAVALGEEFGACVSQALSSPPLPPGLIFKGSIY